MKRFFVAAALLTALLGFAGPVALDAAPSGVQLADTSWGGSCTTPLCQPYM
ncbi:hypothetical protein GCM10009760_21810 [Kitasatospora kazusensis]|uniref:Uncharacterized protein n=1 Tax=Kitasatospora kazusensis TaxID=407974 RepID=A0ABN2ZAV8_9ACTN